MLRISLEFTSYQDGEFGTFAGRVADGLNKNPAYPNPPISSADLGKMVSGFLTAYKQSLEGGIQLASAKNTARKSLERALRQEARYVESIGGDDRDKLVSSGFYAIETGHRSSSPLTQPILGPLEECGTTCLRVKLARVPNARSYQVQFTADGNGGWQDGGIFSGTRNVLLRNLTPGTVYHVRVRAIGGSRGVSDWSQPAMKMAT